MNTKSFVGLVIGAFLVLALTPLATIASLNTVFNLGIEYTFLTWLSVFWLQVLLAWLVRSGVDAAIKPFYQPK